MASARARGFRANAVVGSEPIIMLGATGAMLLGTVLDELERTDKQTALITMCVGGGQGIATVLERL
jgi:acetyl-CoA acetyltransferase